MSLWFLSPALALLTFVTLERLGELWLSHRNTSALLAAGAYEVAPAHYPLIPPAGSGDSLGFPFSTWL
jgi:methyltransferase